MNKIFFSALVMCLLLFSVVSAEIIVQEYSSDFFINAPTQPQICSCDDTQQFPISFGNAGSFTTAYTLFSTDLTLSSSAVVLSPGQTVVVYATLTPVCTQNIVDSASLTIVDGYGQQRVLTFTPELIDCYQTSFALNAKNMTASACADINTQLFIANNGVAVETYVVKTAPPTTQLSAGSVTLPPQTTGTINATFRYACGETGEKTLQYEIDALNQERTFLVEQNLRLEDNYSFTIRSTHLTQPVCQEETNGIELVLINDATFTNMFSIDIDAPEFVYTYYDEQKNVTNAKQIWLAPGEALPFLLVAKPGLDIEGLKPVEIQVTSLYGKERVVSEVAFDVQNCYDADLVGYLPKTKYVCSGDVFEETLTLIATGTKDTPVTLELSGSNQVQLQEASVIVPANGSIEVPVKFTILANETTQEDVIISAKYNNQTIASKSFKLHTDTLATCYALDVDSFATLHYAQDTLRLEVENAGTRYGTYYVTSNASEFELITDTIALGVTEETNIELFNINATTPGQEIVFAITLTHLDSFESFTQEVRVLVVDDPLAQRVYVVIVNFFMQTPTCHLFTLALLVCILIAFIVLLFKPKNRQRRFPKKIILGSILFMILAFIVVSFLVGGIPKLYTSYDLETNSTTYLLLEEDHAKTFLMQDFFFDPDGDIVEYEVLEQNTSVLTASFSGDTLKLVPANDWSGTTMIRLAARDAQNSTAESQLIRVDVLPLEDYSLWGLYAMLCGYVNLALLAILLVLLCVIASFTNKKKRKQPEKPRYY